MSQEVTISIHEPIQNTATIVTTTAPEEISQYCNKAYNALKTGIKPKN